MKNRTYRINEIKLSLDENIEVIPKKIKKKIGKNFDIGSWKIVKESIDARDKKDIKLIYTIDFMCSENLNLKEVEENNFCYKEKMITRNPQDVERPIIIGFGPAGMFAALALAEMGLKPIILERGKKVEERQKDVRFFSEKSILNTESNIQFGEGGAGTFSDGKLTTGINDYRIRTVLRELHFAGAKEEILYKQKPHIGTDVLIKIVKNIRKKITSLGGEIRFNSKAIEIVSLNDDLKRVVYLCEGNEEEIDARSVVVATGQSAIDSYEMLDRLGIKMGQKPFSIGFRIVHSQELIDKSQYGDKELATRLGAASYKLSHKAKNGRGVYTFCMCPGGEVVLASSNRGEIVTNGMSNSKRNSPYANSAILVDVKTDDFESDHHFAGIEFRKSWEKRAFELSNKEYMPIRTTWKDFRNDQNNVMRKALPQFAVEAILEALPNFGNKIKGFDDEGTQLIGIETRSSSPIKIFRDKELQANIKGVYPSGEGAGAAGGIMSAAVDGLKIAEKIRESFID